MNLIYYFEYIKFLFFKRDDADSFNIVKINILKKEKGKRVNNRIIDYIIVFKINVEVASSIIQFLKNSYKYADILIKQKGIKQCLYLFYKPGTVKKSVFIIKKRLIT